ncbi:hypothetical protein [Helicovermis profundi]|uniref:SMC family ATPase n=1 Tax=Helicovermis profundi TaxID=3065157 RepID=A0AAU9EV60_9FIRM|nr:SMC family ATPase [Clostridia bacterium S502]
MENKDERNTVGENVLKEDQLDQIFPNFNSMIENLPGVILQKNDKNNNNNKLKKSINNVISILGPRGSGKSSVFHTIYSKLLNNEKVENDKYIIFKPILPEKVDENIDLLGILLLQIDGYIEKNIDKINFENSKKNKLNINCIYDKKSEVEKKFHQVFSTYYKKNPEFRSILKYNFTTKDEYFDGVKNVLSTELNLADEFKELIRLLLDATKKTNVIFMFDDADLNPIRANEVFDLILKYLDSEHIITFIAVDLNKLKENLSLFYYKKHDVLDNIIDFKLYGEKADISINKYVYDLLKKVMPINNRYRLKELTNEEKMKFSSLSDSDKNNKENKTTLKNLLLEKVLDSSDEQKNEKILNVIADIFDSRPRGLMNIYNFLVKDMESINNLEKLNKMLDIIIETNRILEPRSEEIRAFINVKRGENENEITCFVNYLAINSAIKSEPTKLQDENELKFYIMVLKLGYFFEVITKSDSNNVMLSKLLDNLFSDEYTGNLYPRIGNKLTLFTIYEKIKSITGIKYQYQMLNNNSYKSILKKELKEFEDINDDVWKDLYNSSNSNEKLQEIISKYEGIDYDSKILQDLINKSKSSDKNRIEMPKEIEEEAMKLFYFRYKNRFLFQEEYEDENRRKEEIKIGEIKEFIKNNKNSMDIDIDIEEDIGNIETEKLYELFYKYKKNIELLDKLNIYFEKISGYKKNIYENGSLTRVIKRIWKVRVDSDLLKEDFEKYVYNNIIENPRYDNLKNDEGLIKLSEKIEEIEEDEYSYFKDLTIENKEIMEIMEIMENEEIKISISNEYVKGSRTMLVKYIQGQIESYYISELIIPTIEEQQIVLLNDIYDKFKTIYFKKKLRNYEIIFEILSVSSLNEVNDRLRNFSEKIKISRENGNESEISRKVEEISKYLRKVEHLYEIVTNNEDLIEYLENNEDLIEYLDKIEDTVEYLEKIEDIEGNFKENYGEMYEYDKSKLYDYIIPEIRSILRSINKSNVGINTVSFDRKMENLKMASKIISKMGIRVDARNINVNKLSEIINYSSSNSITENVEGIKSKLLGDGFILLKEFNELIENIDVIIDRESKISSDIKINSIKKDFSVIANKIQDKYDSNILLINTEKLIWEVYRDSLTSKVKESMLEELKNKEEKENE